MTTRIVLLFLSGIVLTASSCTSKREAVRSKVTLNTHVNLPKKKTSLEALAMEHYVTSNVRIFDPSGKLLPVKLPPSKLLVTEPPKPWTVDLVDFAVHRERPFGKKVIVKYGVSASTLSKLGTSALACYALYELVQSYYSHEAVQVRELLNSEDEGLSNQ